MAEKKEFEGLRKDVAELREIIKKNLGDREKTTLVRGRFSWDDADAESDELKKPGGIGLRPQEPHIYLSRGHRELHETLLIILEKLDTIINVLKK